MKKMIILFVIIHLTSLYVYPQSRNSIINEIINKVNPDSLLNTVKVLSGEEPITVDGYTCTLNTRHAETEGNTIAGNYLFNKLITHGLSPYNQPFQYDGENVIAVQQGIGNSDTVYIIGAHYDSYSFEGDFASAPGADDNASGVSAVLEAARILSSYDFDKTIVYVFFDNEEIGLYGSKAYADSISKIPSTVYQSIIIDMIGYDSNNDVKAALRSIDEYGTPELVSKCIDFNQIFKIGIELVIEYNNPYSDHASFWDNHIASFQLGEDHNDFNPWIHSITDRIEKFNLDFFLKCSQLAIASIATLSSKDSPVNINEHLFSRNKCKLEIYPNPISEHGTLFFSLKERTSININLINSIGIEVSSLVDNYFYESGQHNILFEIQGFPVGVYFCTIKAAGFAETVKFVIAK